MLEKRQSQNKVGCLAIGVFGVRSKLPRMSGDLVCRSDVGDIGITGHESLVHWRIGQGCEPLRRKRLRI